MVRLGALQPRLKLYSQASYYSRKVPAQTLLSTGRGFGLVQSKQDVSRWLYSVNSTDEV